MQIKPEHIALDAHRELVPSPNPGRNEPGMVYAHGVRASYEPRGIHGPAVYGYGNDEAAALADLAAQMQFNLDHYGNPVG